MPPQGLILGTNCGFCVDAPSGDPSESTTGIDNISLALNDTSPATATTITEVGWWCDNATQESNFEVGLYDDDGAINNLLEVSRTNAKGTGGGEWKVVTGLNWSIDSSTEYWIAYQLDDTATATNTNRDFAGSGGQYISTSSTLPSTWSGTGVSAYYAVYAIWTSATPPSGTGVQVNIGDSFKSVAGMQVNIGDTWKGVSGAQVNVGDTWKTIF